jgi:hypothetical protein
LVRLINWSAWPPRSSAAALDETPEAAEIGAVVDAPFEIDGPLRVDPLIEVDEGPWPHDANEMNEEAIVLQAGNGVDLMDVSTPPPSMSAEAARALVTEAFNVVLKRDPDKGALDAFTNALRTEVLTPLSLVRELLDSEEFGFSAALHRPVARYLARSIIGSLMNRDPEEAAVSAYADALQGGRCLTDMLRELTASAEFVGLMQCPVSKIEVKSFVPYSLVQLVEGLILDQLTDEGCRIGAPPLNLGQSDAMPEHQVASMIRTLAMLVHTQPNA